MSITPKSLGLSIEIPKGLTSPLSSSKGAVPTLNHHKLVKLTPLRRKGLQEASPESNQDESSDSLVNQDDKSAKDDDDHQQQEGADNEDEEDPLMEVSAPRSLEEVSVKEEDDEEHLSYLPPPSLPVVLVNIERLCGYVPNSETEFEAVAGQVRLALEGDEEFDARAAELFEMGMARHGENNIDDSDSHDIPTVARLKVCYPEFICTSDGRVLSTARVWKKFFRLHSIDVVQRIFDHLKNCNRSLIWKSDMHDELCTLAKTEDEARREAELGKWRTDGRKGQLDKLYQVRETFNHRLEMARIKLEELENEREELIIHQQGKGLQALDLESNIFHVDTGIKPSVLLGIEERISNEGTSESEEDQSESEDEADDEKSTEFDQEGEEDDDVYAIEQAKLTESTQDMNALKKKNRRRRVRRKHRKRLEQASQQAMEKQKVENAIAEEEQIREKCTSQELRMAQAAVQSLEVRMQQVDDLLETMQDDEWADEEEGFKPNATTTNENESGEEISLLDQILAMILGALSPASKTETEASEEEHFHFIRLEHQEIILSWKHRFCRLPRSKVEEQWDNAPKEVERQSVAVPPATLRAELGISDNDEGEWDEIDDLDSLLFNTGKNGSSTTNGVDTTVIKPSGLRPGGTLRPGGNLAK